MRPVRRPDRTGRCSLHDLAQLLGELVRQPVVVAPDKEMQGGAVLGYGCTGWWWPATPRTISRRTQLCLTTQGYPPCYLRNIMISDMVSAVLIAVSAVVAAELIMRVVGHGTGRITVNANVWVTHPTICRLTAQCTEK
jgi:hypothetical protein